MWHKIHIALLTTSIFTNDNDVDIPEFIPLPGLYDLGHMTLCLVMVQVREYHNYLSCMNWLPEAAAHIPQYGQDYKLGAI